MNRAVSPRANEDFQAPEADLQAIVDRTPFMLVRCGRDLRYRFVSRAYADLIGRRPDEVIGKTIAEVIGEESFRALRPHIEAVLQGKPVEFDSEVAYGGSGKRVLRIAYRPEQDENGNWAGWIAAVLDVTGQRRDEGARQQLASIVESSDDAIISKDLNGVIVSWNPGAERLFGYSAEEAVGRPITMLIPQELQDEEPRILQRIRRGERIEHYETVRRRKDGSLFDISLTVSPVRNPEGRIVGASKIGRDVTARKRAEEALARRSDEQFALYQFTDRLYRATSLEEIDDAALDAIVGGLHCDRASILRFDRQGVMRFVTWRGLSDEYRRAVDGHSPWTADDTALQPIVVEDIDNADLPESLRTAIKREEIGALAFIPLMAGGKLAGKFMTYYRTPHVFPAEEMNLALTIARQLGFGIERMRADGERRAAEENLRRFNEQLEIEIEKRTRERDRIWNVSEDLLAVTDFDGHFVSISPAWTRLLGWTEAEIKSMHVSELRHPADNEHSQAGWSELAHGASTVRMENRLRHKDGSWKWISWTMTADQRLIYIVGRHVTAEKEAAAALELAQRQSAHLQKMEALGQLTGGVAHDFNNLLMIVSGHAQSLKQRLSGQQEIRALQAIQMAASRGESLTRQLLAFSRSQPLNPSNLSPADELNALRDVIAGSMNVNMELAIEVPQTIWPVTVDKAEFGLALVNLAVNARDAMPDGGRLSISAENVNLHEGDLPEGLSGDFVALNVRDTGSGIEPENLSKVFEPFFTTKSASKGTGLGLSQVYGFAHRSGGAVKIASELQRGTTVTIYMPRSHAPVSEAAPEDVAHFRTSGHETVLVVEDNHDVRMVTVSLFEQLGYRTIAVESAALALETLESGQAIDAVFSDVVLPGRIDGLALARTIGQRFPRIPVVLTSGYAKVFESDCEFPVLRKPYQIASLGSAISDALDKGRARRAAPN